MSDTARMQKTTVMVSVIRDDYMPDNGEIIESAINDFQKVIDEIKE